MQDRESKEIARSLLSVGTRRKWRPKDYITMAKEFEELRSKVSDTEIARRFSVSSEMIREFRSLLKLSQDVQQLVKDGGVSLIKGYQLSMLSDPNDQKTLALAIIEHKMPTPELREVVKLKRRNPTMPIEECIEAVLQTRPILEELHIVGMEIQDSTMKELCSVVELAGVKVADAVKDILRAGIPTLQGIESIVIRGNLALLQLDKDNFQKLEAKAQKEHLKIENLLEYLIGRWLTTQGK